MELLCGILIIEIYIQHRFEVKRAIEKHINHENLYESNFVTNWFRAIDYLVRSKLCYTVVLGWVYTSKPSNTLKPNQPINFHKQPTIQEFSARPLRFYVKSDTANSKGPNMAILAIS